MMIIDSYRFGGGGSCPSYTPGLYTAEEIDTLVNVDGYIPVASAAEFDAIRSGAAETMGAGTCWEDTYTTGLGEKYVQILDCDFTTVSSTWLALTALSSLIYDGNNLSISNFTRTSAGPEVHLFSANSLYTFKNSRIYNYNVNKLTSGNCGVLGEGRGTYTNINIYDSSFRSNVSCCTLLGLGSGVAVCSDILISNCTVNGTLGVYGVGRSCNVSDSTVDNCNITGTGDTAGICNGAAVRCAFTNSTINSSSGNVVCGITTKQGVVTEDCIVLNSEINAAGFITCGIAQARGGSTIKRNKIENTDINVTGTRNRVGGISGLYFSGTNIVEKCEVINCNIDAPNSDDVGGIIGYDQQLGQLRNCRVVGGTINGSSRVGGLIGRISLSTTVCEKSYSTAAVTGSTSVGGAVGQSVVNANTLDLYWDTVASGNATSAGGAEVEGKTTSELQTPTTNSGIYSAWTIPPWDFGTASEYPTLTTTP